METIRERLLPKAAQSGKGISLGKAVVFPRETISRFRNEQDELNYCLCMHMKDEQSDFYDSVLSDLDG